MTKLAAVAWWLGLFALTTLLVFLFLGDGHAQTVPDAPQPQGQYHVCWTIGPYHKCGPRESYSFAENDLQGYLYTGGHPNLPTFMDARIEKAAPRTFAFQPNRTHKQTMTSLWYVLPHLAAFGAAIWEKKRTGNQGQWPDALIPVGVITGIDYPMDRWIQRGISVGDAAYMIGRDSYGAISRNYQ